MLIGARDAERGEAAAEELRADGADVRFVPLEELRAEGILVNAVSPGYCATDLNRHSGMRTAEEGAAVAVGLATAGEDGPTGAFLSEDGPIPW